MKDGPSKCPRCAGELEYGKQIEWSVREGTDVALVTVTADVCTRCGERLVTAAMGDKLVRAKRLLKSGNKAPAVGKVYDMRADALL